MPVPVLVSAGIGLNLQKKFGATDPSLQISALVRTELVELYLDDGLNLTNVERLMLLATSGNSVLSIDDVHISDASTGGGVTKVPLR